MGAQLPNKQRNVHCTNTAVHASTTLPLEHSRSKLQRSDTLSPCQTVLLDPLKCLGQWVGQLVIRVTSHQSDQTRLDGLADEVVLNVDVLGSVVYRLVASHIGSTVVVYTNCRNHWR